MAKKKISYDLYGKLQLASIEREVEDAYNNGISLFFTDSPIEHPYQCDGYLTEGLMLRLLIEYKFDEILSNAVVRAKVLVQVLFYLKQFEEGGLPLPNVIMVGDKNECFVIHSNDIVGYLDEKINWSTAPSRAADANPELVTKIATNEDINPYIFKIEKGFRIDVVIDRIRDLSVNVKRYIRVTEHNISEIFDNFSLSVLRNPQTLEAHKLVEVFIGILLEPLDYYQHPKNPNLLVAGKDKVAIYGDAYRAFFDYYNQTYTPQEKMKFTEIADRLIEDVTRRRNGEFFTPTSFVDYAHRLLERQLGQDWKNQYVVWDCAAGTKNLTRDYRFKKLYCSTLVPEDLQLSNRYNPESESFIFDFLNDSLDKIPVSLKKLLEKNVPFVFFINPPWGTANDAGAKGTSKAGMAKTNVNSRMLSNGMGSSSQNLYAQFLYRIYLIKEKYKLTDCNIAVFCPTLYLTGPSWAPFRQIFFESFVFREGFQFNASHFANVKPTWGASFALWTTGIQKERNCFSFNLVDRRDNALVEFGKVTVYNMDGKQRASEWVRELVKDRPVVTYPNATSALRIDEGKTYKIVQDAIGYIQLKGNNVNENPTGVSFMSMMYANAHGVSVTRENFRECCALYAARKLVVKNWINSKNEYCIPDINHPDWDEFVSDAVVFSLFHASSNQSSLRDVRYNGVDYDIKNEFFFIKRESMIELANKYNNTVCYQDAHTDNERFIYEYLKSTELSKEATDVLQKASLLVSSSFRYRIVFDMEHPEYQINNWDAGWYQVKALLKQYDKKGVADFSKKFDVLSRKMLPKVYELGFLLR